MFSKSLCVIFLVAGVVMNVASSHITPAIDCGPNEVYQYKGYCEPFCSPSGIVSRSDQSCVPGCKCEAGYVRREAPSNVVKPSIKCIEAGQCRVMA